METAPVFTVAGVPAHPLLVHAVVVLIPLSALGAVALALRPAWSRPYGPLVAAGALAGAVVATLAKLAGDQLETVVDVTEEFVPVIAQHERFGLFTVVAAWPFAVCTVAAAVLDRRTGGPAVRRVVPGLAAVSGLAALAVTVLAGHTGADAVWGSVTP